MGFDRIYAIRRLVLNAAKPNTRALGQLVSIRCNRTDLIFHPNTGKEDHALSPSNNQRGKLVLHRQPG